MWGGRELWTLRPMLLLLKSWTEGPGYCQEQGFYPVSTFLAGRWGRRASPQGQPLSPSFLLSLSGVTGFPAGSLHDSPLPQPLSPPPPTTCRPTRTLRIQPTRMLIGNSLAFPASLCNPGRRRLSQSHSQVPGGAQRLDKGAETVDMCS